MDGYVIVPGIDGSGEEHWQTLWERRWGPRAFRIEPGSWATPDLADWTGAVQEAFGAVSSRADRVVLVAHSLGCWAVAEWARQAQPAAVAAFLVAPPDLLGPAFPGTQAPTFLPLSARPLPVRSLLVASGDDPYCGTGVSESLARGWAAEWHFAGNHGHLNSASGLGDWQAGQELLDAFTERSALGPDSP
jgi:uncharacterized protein